MLRLHLTGSLNVETAVTRLPAPADPTVPCCPCSIFKLLSQKYHRPGSLKNDVLQFRRLVMVKVLADLAPSVDQLLVSQKVISLLCPHMLKREPWVPSPYKGTIPTVRAPPHDVTQT